MIEALELYKRIYGLWFAESPKNRHDGSLSWVVGRAVLGVLETEFERRQAEGSVVGLYHPYRPEIRSGISGGLLYVRTICGRPVALDGDGDEVRLESDPRHPNRHQPPGKTEGMPNPPTLDPCPSPTVMATARSGHRDQTPPTRHRAMAHPGRLGVGQGPPHSEGLPR